MAVSAALSSFATRRGFTIAALLIGLAATLSLVVLRPGSFSNRARSFGDAISGQVGDGVARLNAFGGSVADIFGARSPGERVAGALASLKPKRTAILRERALPKIRGPLPLAGVVVAPLAPAVAPAVPLYNIVNGAPAVPVAASAPPGGPPIVFPGFMLPPGGGGGIIIPPVVTTPPVTPPATPPVTPPITPPVTPPVTPPTTSGVPEPGTWAMMLLGFAMIGSAFRRYNRTPSKIPVR